MANKLYLTVDLAIARAVIARYLREHPEEIESFAEMMVRERLELILQRAYKKEDPAIGRAPIHRNNPFSDVQDDRALNDLVVKYGARGVLDALGAHVFSINEPLAWMIWDLIDS